LRSLPKLTATTTRRYGAHASSPQDATRGANVERRCVHVYGKPAASEDRDFSKAALVDLIAKYESTRSNPWRAEGLAPDVFDKLALLPLKCPSRGSKASSN
jgi:hypothetical protein